MSDIDQPRVAEDGFERYYAEKLWSWIPEVHRDADFTSSRGPVMRPLVEVIAGEAATARRAIDRLWENVLIDYADEWAVPYIGELIGARLLASINGRGVRADVARTFAYRQRAGTVAVLDQLIQDITGWSGIVVEAWRRLGRDWHGLDDSPFAGAVQHGTTPRGGFADLRLRRQCDARDGAFDGFAHRSDFRRLRGTRGHYAVPKIDVHVFRRMAEPIARSMGLKLAPKLYAFDPSGRAIALFAGVPRGDPGHYVPPQPWHLPQPVAPSLLDHALFDITPATSLLGMGPRLAALVGTTIEGQRQLAELARLDIGGPPTYPAATAFRALQAATRRMDCGKYRLIGDALRVSTGTSFAGLTNAAPEYIAAASMSATAAPADFPAGTGVLIDPERGIARLDSDTMFRPDYYHYGCFAPIGAGGHERAVTDDPGALLVNVTPTSLDPIALAPAGLEGVARFRESMSWTVSGTVPDFTRLVWKATTGARPYVLLARSSGNMAVLRAKALDVMLPADDPANQREIEIDGLWLSVLRATYPEQVLASPDQAVAPVTVTIVIDATVAPVQRVVLRNVTLDPGGERARVKPCRGVAVPLVRLQLRGEIGELLIENSVIGPIDEYAAADDPCSAGSVVIRDSIIQSIKPSMPAIGLKTGRLTIERSTVFGSITADRMDASELLVTGMVTIADNQHGCFRFSAAGDDPAMRLPRQYESHRIAGGIAPHMFVSQRCGDAGFAQLSETAAAEIMTGAENGSEIGAYSSVLGPIRLADLATKLDEYAPLNTIAGIVLAS